jgi:cell division transport system permease protein
MRVQYLLSQAFVSLRRNPLVVVSAITVVLVMLVLVFSAIVLRWSIDQDIGRWDDNVRVIAFLTDDLTVEDVDALQREIQGWQEVEEVVYFSKSEALDEFRELFEDQPALIEVVEEDPSTLPASLRIKPIEAGDYSSITDRLVSLDGVREVSAAEEAIDALVTRSQRMSAFAVTVSIVLGGAAVVLIATTIRMAIYARREEIEIMKLVGAGNWYVRIPFLLEGIIEGLAGALVAVVIVWVAHPSIVQLLSTVADPDAIDVPFSFLFQQSLLVLFFGAATGLLGSSFGMWGFLRD